MAILDIHDLGLAREKGRDLVGVMAFVQSPLAAVLAQPGIRTPARPRGRARRASAGCRPTSAVLRSVVAGAGGDPARVKQMTIGFEAVKALLAQRVAAATAFWNVEGVALKAKRPGMREFRVDDYGAPSLPGARPHRHAARRSTSSRRSCRPRSARCSAATPRSRTTRRAPSRR